MHFGNFGHFPFKKKKTKTHLNEMHSLILLFARRGVAAPCFVPVASAWSGLILWLSRESALQPATCLWLWFISGQLWRKHHRMSDKATRQVGWSGDPSLFCVLLEPTPSLRNISQEATQFTSPLSQQLFTNHVMCGWHCSRDSSVNKNIKSLLSWTWRQTMRTNSRMSQGRWRWALRQGPWMGSDLGRQSWELRRALAPAVRKPRQWGGWPLSRHLQGVRE